MIFAKEVETKYRADDISLSEFTKACEAKKPKAHIIASGWDRFYDGKSAEGFARHRIGADFNQLTFKRKTSGSNNFIRDEDNLDLSQRTLVSQVDSFLGKFGYKYNKSIYKNCFIYKFHDHTVVFYVIYDETIKEIGRFIEIEMSEEPIWATEEDAWNALVNIEKDWKHLGLNARSRMKKSLYEIVCQ